MASPPPPAPPPPELHLREPNPGALPDDLVELLSGGAQAFPRMLEAIQGAKRRIHLEVYTFTLGVWGRRFVDALRKAAWRGVKVRVMVDGWGSVEDSEELAFALEDAGAEVRVYNPLSGLLLGKLVRNHRKVLVVDDDTAFIGGINIGDEYAHTAERAGWADLAVEIRGPSARALALRVWEGGKPSATGRLRVWLSGIGGGFKLRRRYVHGFQEAREEVLLAHAYFLPDRGLVRAILQAARRGVKVSLLLAGRSDVAFARAATMRLYNQLLRGGVRIFEWQRSVLHAKAAVIDSRRFLVGSFNLDPLSLSNLEAMVELDDPRVASKARTWMECHIGGAQEVTLAQCGRSKLQAWLLDVLGLMVARAAEWFARVAAVRPLR